MIIETSNLLIEPICEKSLSYILKNIDYTFSVPIPKHTSKYQIKKFIFNNDKIRCFNSLGYLVIKLKKDLIPIGFLSIIPRYINENLVNELGYFIIKHYRNNGFMCEAIFNILNYIFNNTNIDKIYSLIEDSNTISKHILENNMMFDFIGSLMDHNTLKRVYYIDKLDFITRKRSIYTELNKYIN